MLRYKKKQSFPLGGFLRGAVFYFIKLLQIGSLTSYNKVLFDPSRRQSRTLLLLVFNLTCNSYITKVLASNHLFKRHLSSSLSVFVLVLPQLSFLLCKLPSRCESLCLTLIHLWSFTPSLSFSPLCLPFFSLASLVHCFCPWLPSRELLALSPCHWVMDYLHANGSAWKD